MSRRKQIKSKEQFDTALDLERSGDTAEAIKHYQKATKTDPTNARAWNRLMVLYRKTRSKEEEVKLIELAIVEYEISLEFKQQQWLEENREKAESTRELAQVLGMLEPTGLPKKEHTLLENWETRRYLLDYRIKNARKKKTQLKKTKSSDSKKITSNVKSKTSGKVANTKATKKKATPSKSTK